MLADMHILRQHCYGCYGLWSSTGYSLNYYTQSMFQAILWQENVMKSNCYCMIAATSIYGSGDMVTELPMRMYKTTKHDRFHRFPVPNLMWTSLYFNTSLSMQIFAVSHSTSSMSISCCMVQEIWSHKIIKTTKHSLLQGLTTPNVMGISPYLSKPQSLLCPMVQVPCP